MNLLLAAVLANPALEWSGWWYEQIERATLVVAGEVVEIRPHGEKNRAAMLRVKLVLKGECKEKELALPFKNTRIFGCDFEIEYEKAKYLLLIDDKEYFRLVLFPDHPQIKIADYDAPEVRFTRAVIDIRAGVEPEKRILDIEPILKLRRHSRQLEAVAFVRTLPRWMVRPLFPSLRRELGPGLKSEIDLAKSQDRSRKVDMALVCTFDLTLVESVLGRREPFDDPFPTTQARRDRRESAIRILSRVIGREYQTFDELRLSWPMLLRRAQAKGKVEEIPVLLRQLGCDAAAERDAAAKAILDNGPSVLEAVRANAKNSDPEVRARVTGLVTELEFLQELRSAGQGGH